MADLSAGLRLPANGNARLERLGAHLGQIQARAAAITAAATGKKKPRLALVTTVWFAGTPAAEDGTPGVHGTPSHSVHMGDRFLTGWPMGGEWHTPGLDVVSAYVDQVRRPAASRLGRGAACYLSPMRVSTPRGDAHVGASGRSSEPLVPRAAPARPPGPSRQRMVHDGVGRRRVGRPEA